MSRRSLRKAALMFGGALVFVQALVTVFETKARPVRIDPAFVAEMQQAQYTTGTRAFGLPNHGR
jgi:hypothetical protein